jgi:hypothetical protein
MALFHFVWALLSRFFIAIRHVLRVLNTSSPPDFIGFPQRTIREGLSLNGASDIPDVFSIRAYPYKMEENQ